MKILIVKTGALGDVLRSSFIAQALKDKYKDRDPIIYWITAKNAVPLIASNKYIDHYLVSDEKEKLRNVSFDLVVNLEESKEDCAFVSKLKKKRLIGPYLDNEGNIMYGSDLREWFDMSIISKYGKKKADRLKIKNKKTHRQLIGEGIGVKWRKYEPFLRLNEKQRTMAQSFLRRHRLSRSDMIVGINVGSADRWPKDLPMKKTAMLIDKIHKKYGAKILLFGGPGEVERNKDVIALSKSPIIDTGCGNDLSELPALASVCSFFVTTDSLGLHVALALKRRTVCLVGPTSPSELGMYGLGKVIVSKSKDVCTYKTKTRCMDKIDLNEIVEFFDEFMNQKITFLITAFNEPESIGRAIEAALNQKTKYKYDILVSAPDEKTLSVVRKISKKHKNVKSFKDPGKGKSFALNLLFKKISCDILILSDGDVYVSENSVEDLVNLFLDPEVGCVTGRPVPIEDRKSKYGYWANFLFDAAHSIRLKSSIKNDFIECSGYLFGFRKKKINMIPLDVAEDTVIPYFFWEKGYRIGYGKYAKVFVKNADNLRDWVKQKIRTSKAHETLDKYVNVKSTPRVKNFRNESKGASLLIQYPQSIRELGWTMQLFLFRLCMWGCVFLDTKLRNKHYGDSWERVDSTK